MHQTSGTALISEVEKEEENQECKKVYIPKSVSELSILDGDRERRNEEKQTFKGIGGNHLRVIKTA